MLLLLTALDTGLVKGDFESALLVFALGLLRPGDEVPFTFEAGEQVLEDDFAADSFTLEKADLELGTFELLASFWAGIPFFFSRQILSLVALEVGVLTADRDFLVELGVDPVDKTEPGEFPSFLRLWFSDFFLSTIDVDEGVVDVWDLSEGVLLPPDVFWVVPWVGGVGCLLVASSWVLLLGCLELLAAAAPRTNCLLQIRTNFLHRVDSELSTVFLRMSLTILPRRVSCIQAIQKQE